MSEEKRFSELKDAGRVHGAAFKPAEEPLSSKQLFRIAAELQEWNNFGRSPVSQGLSGSIRGLSALDILFLDPRHQSAQTFAGLLD